MRGWEGESEREREREGVRETEGRYVGSGLHGPLKIDFIDARQSLELFGGRQYTFKTLHPLRWLPQP
jgi:hypothetical protein